MTRFCLALSLLALAACGVDGEPERPRVDAAIGVSNSGVHGGANVSMGRGPVTVGVGVWQ